MSEYIVAKTVFKAEHLDCLVEALQEAAPQFKGHVEVHEKAVQLEGYGGDQRAQRANVVVRRQFVQASANDLGFETMPDGSVIGHISEYDSGKYGKTFLNTLSQHYALKVTEKQAARIGATLEKVVQPDGSWKITLVKPNPGLAVVVGRKW